MNASSTLSKMTHIQGSNSNLASRNTSRNLQERDESNSLSSSDDKKTSSYYSITDSYPKLFGTCINYNKPRRRVIGKAQNDTSKCRKDNSIFGEGSSSDDAVFQPNKHKFKHKYKTASAFDISRPPSNFALFTRRISSDTDENVGDKKHERTNEKCRSKNPKNKKHTNVYSRSSSSSRSRSCSRPRSYKNQLNPGRSRSHSGSRKLPSAQNAATTSGYTNASMMSGNNCSDRVRNQSQNTEVMGLDTTFSTVDNEAFLKRVEEVLSEIVEQKKKKILQRESREKMNPVNLARAGENEKKKIQRKSVGKWVLSKHYDISEGNKNKFSHIITSHGDVRLRYRSQSSDLLETHRNCFTKLEPYKPRILRKDVESKLLVDKSYQPPRYRSKKHNSSSTEKLEVTSDNNYKDSWEATQSETNESVETNKSHKTSTVDEMLITNNTETDDTCYESEHADSECALATVNDSKNARHDPAEASVDSAYTGSRGPTPDDQSNLRVKVLTHKVHDVEKQTTTETIETKSNIQTITKGTKEIVSLDEPEINRVRREILCELRDIGIYSDYAITSLLELYRRKYKNISKQDMSLLSSQIKKKFDIYVSESFDYETKVEDIVSHKSPAKSRVRFDAQLEKVILPRVEQVDNSDNGRDNYTLLPTEALDLKKVLSNSKNTDDAVRWLSLEELQEVKEASTTLVKCTTMADTTDVLGKASTWEELAQVLDIPSISQDSTRCIHANNSTDLQTKQYDMIGSIPDSNERYDGCKTKTVLHVEDTPDIRVGTKATASKMNKDIPGNIDSSSVDIYTSVANKSSQACSNTDCMPVLPDLKTALHANKTSKTAGDALYEDDIFDQHIEEQEKVTNASGIIYAPNENLSEKCFNKKVESTCPETDMQSNNGETLSKILLPTSDHIHTNLSSGDNVLSTTCISSKTDYFVGSSLDRDKCLDKEVSHNYSETNSVEEELSGVQESESCNTTCAIDDSSNKRVIVNQTKYENCLHSYSPEHRMQELHTGSSREDPQTSLAGKLAELTESYTEERPEWLVVADEVCKQFNISL